MDIKLNAFAKMTWQIHNLMGNCISPGLSCIKIGCGANGNLEVFATDGRKQISIKTGIGLDSNCQVGQIPSTRSFKKNAHLSLLTKVDVFDVPPTTDSSSTEGDPMPPPSTSAAGLGEEDDGGTSKDACTGTGSDDEGTSNGACTGTQTDDPPEDACTGTQTETETNDDWRIGLEFDREPLYKHEFNPEYVPQTIHEEFIFLFPDSKWKDFGWRNLSRHVGITLDFIDQNPEKPWDWGDISTRHDITFEYVLKHLDKPWNWGAGGISSNPFIINLEFLKRFEHKSLDWGEKGLSSNISITPEILEHFPKKPWDDRYIMCNLKFSFETYSRIFPHLAKNYTSETREAYAKSSSNEGLVSKIRERQKEYAQWMNADKIKSIQKTLYFTHSIYGHNGNGNERKFNTIFRKDLQKDILFPYRGLFKLTPEFIRENIEAFKIITKHYFDYVSGIFSYTIDDVICA